MKGDALAAVPVGTLTPAARRGAGYLRLLPSPAGSNAHKPANPPQSGQRPVRSLEVVNISLASWCPAPLWFMRVRLPLK